MGFEYMHKHKLEIETAEGTFSPIAKGITSIEPDPNEETDQTKYMDGEGFSETDVIGAQLILSVSGHRYYGDTAQDYIFGKLLQIGSARRTNFRWTQPDGRILEGDCTMVNISPDSGDAGTKGEVSFEIHFNGAVTETAPTP